MKEKIKVFNRINDGFFIEAHIADLHFGAFDPAKQYQILYEQFILPLSRINVLDLIVIEGDIFHHKFMANSDSVMYANMFIDCLVKLANSKQATIIIISGTYEHDADQLKLFYPYANKADLRIVEEVRFEYIKGKRVLCIPELYGKPESYYASFLYDSGLYDACYLHGTIAGTIYGKDIPDLGNPREPIFGINHFINCRGPIICGHNHKPGCHDVYIYYCGCPYRWEFGQEEEKGFIILLHNLNTGEHMINFEPIKSFRYDTVNLDSMLQATPDQVIQYITELRESGIDYLRVQFTEDNVDLIPIIRSFYRREPHVTIDLNFKKNKVIDEMKEVQEKYSDYSYLKEKSDPETKLVSYINQKEGYTFITVDELRDFLKSL